MKEWKGNKNSTRAALCVKSPNSDNERQEDDFYATDPKALEALINAPCVSYNQRTQDVLLNCFRVRGYYIWEPAAGNGNLSNYLREHGYNVIASDLKYRGCTDGSIVDGLDFLTTYPYNKFKGAAAHPYVILTNPPYSLATEFVEHALNILPNGGLYIALMNITYLHGIDRYKRVYSKGTLREVYVFSKKIHVYKNNIPTGHTSMCVYAWYVFQKGYNGQPTLYWL